jgi:hypothetical protein
MPKKKPRRHAEWLPEPDLAWMKTEAEWHKKTKTLSVQNADLMKSISSPLVLKLTIELVPESLWGRGLRKLIARSKWDALRQQVMERFRSRCAVCGAEARHAHEVWEYDDANHVQRLREIIPICDLCHQVKHLGRTRKLAGRMQMVQSRAEYHFLEVNRCDLAILHEHERQAWETWRERNRHEWTVDYGPYAHLVEQNP